MALDDPVDRAFEIASVPTIDDKAKRDGRRRL
jgi:hypothetical protein